MDATGMFLVENRGATIVVTPQQDPDELTFGESGESELADVFHRLDVGESVSVVVDCHRIERCCSSGIAFFIKLLKNAERNGGRFAFCNVSAHLSEVFEMLHLNTLWRTCGSLDEALAVVADARAN
jgi:anti-anti-sigma regulatory factor